MTSFNFWAAIAIALYFATGYLLTMILFDEEDRKSSFLVYLMFIFWIPVMICFVLGAITDKIRKKICG